METFSNYYKALMTQTDEERRLIDEISKENERFESTPEYIEHWNKIQELWKQEHEAFEKKMASAKEIRPRRNTTNTNEKPQKPKKVEHSKELEEAIKMVEALSESDKRNLYFLTMKEEIPKDKEHMLPDEDINELHTILVQTVIDFIKEKGWEDKVVAFGFGAVGLMESSKFGEWTPATDSSLSIEGLRSEDFKGKKIPYRVKIGESF